MISVITPSHDPRWLDECWESLVAQTCPDFEWVVLLNGDAVWTPPADPRVRVHHAATTGVGAAKRGAAERARGEILLELDHDDLLTSDALREVTVAFTDPAVQFVYSSCAQINADRTPNLDEFNAAHGWVYEPIRADGVTYHAAVPLAPTPHNMSYIWYAPNHLRAWDTNLYWQVGGHDPTLEVADDHELMCRTFQATRPRLIHRLLYLQRVGHVSTQVARNAAIQEATVRIYADHVQANALAWAGRAGLACLDLGGAHNPAPGYATVDLHDADIEGDILTLGLPESSVGVVRAVDFLEHVPDKVGLFNELYRILAPGGMLLSLTPSTDGRGAFQDPTHVAFYNENSFWYFTDRDYARFVPEIRCRFQVSHLSTFHPSDWHREHDIPYVQANLIAVKPGPRDGGILRI